MTLRFAMFIFILGGLSACRTLDLEAEKVEVIAKIEDDCKSLGTVNVVWSWWGTTAESLNVMKNQVAEKGGNALFVQGNEIGTAFYCTKLSLRQ